jgi:hypothetical protein
VVVCLPIPDPDRYVEGKFPTVYSAWTTDGPRDPQHSPEGVVVQKMMDQYQPEVHADIHGTNLAFDRYIMFESSGTAYSNLALRPYHRDVIRQMDEAALAEGFPCDTAESDAERCFGGKNLEPIGSKFWPGQPNVYAGIYCYYHYHTLVSASEVAWERSGLVRHRRLLEIGNETWPGEFYRGYPTRVILANTHEMVTAYGQTASMRRQSRVELWNKLPQITLGLLDPVVEGKAVAICATSKAAAKNWLSAPSLKTVVSGLRNHPGMNVEPMARFLEGWPGSQNNPEAMLALQNGGAAKPGEEKPIEHGISLRLRLGYGKAKIQDLRLNGNPLAQSETDGFVTWKARGCTFIQVNVPPNRLRTDDLFLVTCQYDPCEKRSHWDSWRSF